MAKQNRLKIEQTNKGVIYKLYIQMFSGNRLKGKDSEMEKTRVEWENRVQNGK